MPTLNDPAYVAQSQAYLTLRKRWRASPVRYVQQRFGIDPTPQQARILHALAPPGAKVSVRSGHGIGKSACDAWVILWHLETHAYSKVPCTAPTAQQMRDILWGELSKWRRHADEQSARRGDHPDLYLSRLFHLTQDRLYDLAAPEWAATARTARKESPEALQGFHATHLLFVIDEASGIDEAIFEAAEGALSTPGARVLMLGNPTRNSGTFAASHKQNRGEYTALHFRSADSPLVDPGYRERLVRKWGELADGQDVDEIDVDEIALGAGVVDRLVEVKRQQKKAWDVVGVNVANAAPVTPVKGEPRPHKMRDYLWLEMARWLRDEDPVFAAEARGACEDLAGELASSTYKPNSDGDIVVEDKDSMKKRLGHSPDIADALGCTFAPALQYPPLRIWGG